MPSLVTILIAIGAVVLVAGLFWAIRALSPRSQPPAVIDPDADLDQTCELNYKPE